MRHKLLLFFLIVVSLTNVRARPASAASMMGEETIGNKPFDGANYKPWPGILPVINNKSRVYHTWVNGDERFYYSPTTEQLNQLLADFGKLKGKREVLIVPQAKNVSTFDQKRNFEFNCQLHLVGGIAKHTAGKAKGSIYLPLEPQLTIHVTPKTDLDKLTIPKGVTLVSLAEIKARYKSGLDSTAQEVRGLGVGFFVGADPYDGESLRAVAKLIVDADQWVALNAITYIVKFGPKAKDHLATLRKIAESGTDNNAKKAKKVIPEIESHLEEEAVTKFETAEKKFRQQESQAKTFIDRVRGL